MNNYIVLGEKDFHKSIQSMKVADKESLQRLLSREVVLAKEELNRYEEILKLAKSKKNQLECYKNEQHMRDTELLIEQLGRKLLLCQKEIESSKNLENIEPMKISNNHNSSDCLSNNSLLSSPTHLSNNTKSNPPSQGTKSLINNFQKVHNTSTENASQSKNTSSIVNSKFLQPRRSLAPKMPVDETPPISFMNIKLKKVGLPSDAKEVEHSVRSEENLAISKDQPDGYRKLLTTNGIYSFPKSPSVDLGASSTLKIKDKFRNTNKEIQQAIQNELKDLKLRKTNNSPQNQTINCKIDEMGLGRFNFVNEQSAPSSACSTVKRMSASKSMPFLNNFNVAPMSSCDSTDSVSTMVDISVENLNQNKNNFNNNESSSISNWDPLTVLKEMYWNEKSSIEVQSQTKKESKNISGFIDMLPGLSSNSSNSSLWKRRFALISNGELRIFEDKTSRSALNVFEVKSINIIKINDVTLELHDNRGVHSTLKFPKQSDYIAWIEMFQNHSSYKTSEIIPSLYDAVSQNSANKILIMDIGSCSIRAGLLKSEATLPKIFFPNIAAINKKTMNVVNVGLEAIESMSNEDCDIIRPLKPDTTIEDIAFTTGTVELIFRKTCSLLNIDPKEYVIMLSLPHNVAEATRTKLADVLLLRLNFKGVSMFGQSLLALHAYGEHTGVLVDIGQRTEILPVVHGIVQNAAASSSIYGGHLIQIALSHLLPFESHSLTDFFLVRYIMEKACFVAESADKSQNNHDKMDIDLDKLQLPPQIPRSICLKGMDRCLPAEGLFNPEIYFLDSISLPKLIVKSIQSCPMDNRKDLYQSICLSGAASQISGLKERLEKELKLLLPNNCNVKIRCSPNRTHFSYVGACFVALSDGFARTIVNRCQWEESRTISLKKWNC